VLDLKEKGQKKILSFDEKHRSSLCALCRGTKMLCGKHRCPVVVRFHSKGYLKNIWKKATDHIPLI